MYFDMYDPENIRNCDECPMNEGIRSGDTDLPCGQFHCWVEIHCKRNDELSEEDSL